MEKSFAMYRLPKTGDFKGPKLELFVAEFFTQTKPVWGDDIETRK